MQLHTTPVQRPFQWWSIHPNPFLHDNTRYFGCTYNTTASGREGRRCVYRIGALYRSAAAAAGRGGGTCGGEAGDGVNVIDSSWYMMHGES